MCLAHLWGPYYLVFDLSIFLEFFSPPIYKLENDPMCGITTGGREDCFWDCEVESTVVNKGLLLTPPECLLHCFSKVYLSVQVSDYL